MSRRPADRVHPVASTGFAGAAAEYERGRPGYPAPALAWIRERLELRPGRTVLDLAAGTGKLTRELLETGAEVVAVEPVAEMRAALPPAARALDGTAERIPLPDASVDAVTVAQAYHWFDGEHALAEIHRVLRAGGALALVWNVRREDDPVNRALEDIMAPHRRESGAPQYADGAWRASLERTALFGALEEREFPQQQVLDADGLADRVGSVSFIASLEEGARGDLLRRVRALAGDGAVDLPYTTRVYACERRGQM